ncbi:MAG: hypothetical protein HMLKMBBP_01855 [Planctomycetes bacterium]|nr:hypothetical protein [Planctomycetota bacterium]
MTAPDASPSPGAGTAAMKRAAIAASALVTTVAFLPAIRGNLMQWDDHPLLVENTRYRGLSWDSLKFAFGEAYLGPWQPLPWLSYAADHAIWGGDAHGFHVTNVLLQALCAALLAALAWTLLPRAVPALRDRPGALAAASAGAALLWAAHPQRVESVAWASERRDVLSAAFLLASFLAWIRHSDRADDEPKWWRSGAWRAALALFFCSLLSKATAIGWVLVLAAWESFVARRPLRGPRLAALIPFLAAGLAVAAVAWFAQHVAGATVSADDFSLAARPVLALYATGHHLLATFLPVSLRAHYQRPPSAEMFTAAKLATASLGLLVVVAVPLLRHRAPWTAFTAAAYIVLLAPVSGLTLTGSHLVADRYSHQPTLGVGLLLAGAVAAHVLGPGPVVRPRLAAAACGALLAVYAGLAAHVSSLWRDPLALWTHVLVHEPRNFTAHAQIAKEHHNRGNLELARAHLLASLDARPGRPIPTVFLGLVESQLGDWDSAARRIAPLFTPECAHAPAWTLRGLIEQHHGDMEAASASYRRALEITPDSTDCLMNYGQSLADLGRWTEALPVARKLRALQPESARAGVFLGVVLHETGDVASARTEIEAAARRDPSDPLARDWLARLR